MLVSQQDVQILAWSSDEQNGICFASHYFGENGYEFA